MSETWRTRRVPELDGLRGLAILLVLLCHYLKNAIVIRSFWISVGMAPLRLSSTGVDLFFVLSGFLIGGILLDTRDSPGYYQTFYSRRFFRILPVYYVWLALFGIGLAVAPPTLAGVFNTSLPAWSYPLFLQNIFMSARDTLGAQWLFVTWSLAVEEQFYLLIPFAIRVFDRRALTALLAVAVIGAPIARLYPLSTGHFVAQLSSLPCRADALGLGILVALAVRHRYEWLKSHRRWFYASLAVLWCGTVFVAFGQYGLVLQALSRSWMAVFYTNLLLLAVVNPARVEHLVFGNSMLVGLGKISYGVYLFHEGIRSLMHYAFFHSTAEVYDLRTFGVTALSAVVVIALAAASWRLLEQPLLEFAHGRYRRMVPGTDSHNSRPVGASVTLPASQ
jgi:peptidoglycan/LPS O-acetylase OafA/YrhL